MKTKFKLLCTASLLLSSGLLQAGPIDIYTHTINNPSDGTFQGVNPRGGDVQSIKTTYNATDEEFSWEYTVAPGAGNSENDGFWLVVSDGPDPKGDTDEYAILFGDLDTNRLTAYLYSGTNSPRSWDDPGVLIGSFDAGELQVTPGAAGSDLQTVSFNIDVAAINSHSNDPEWDGVSFAELVGIWFHPTTGSNFEYNGAGEITHFSSNRAGWYDGRDILVRQVPEPAILYSFGIGLLGFCFSKKMVRRREKNTVA